MLDYTVLLPEEKPVSVLFLHSSLDFVFVECAQLRVLRVHGVILEDVSAATSILQLSSVEPVL